MTDEEFIDRAYSVFLNRPGDEDGRAHNLGLLRAGQASRHDLVIGFTSTNEYIDREINGQVLHAFHGGRVTWTRSLPPARRILDLGGTALGDDRGALVGMGYPYSFDEVVIIELPPEDRHGLYRTPPNRSVQLDQGQVTYMYRSMVDLADLPDASFDMICSAQTFEHVYPDAGVHILKEVTRLLTPDGVLALDTPNKPVSYLQARDMGEEVINPDHKKEYTHAEMLELFVNAGLRVVRQHGIGYMPQSVAEDRYIKEEHVRYPGLYDDIEKCYTLAYLATRE
ncbi:2-polyprenyl-3-methyl-5-hydroxy-6-metoxy-1,4-benzoquinol methylase [Frankineae bacterium MT45]|nr:2-polyprenyl-3-methyl-5-hydroxy-6-metoxy-1,4-benzoquinol methylase [Frankineae bacterium MT45]